MPGLGLHGLFVCPGISGYARIVLILKGGGPRLISCILDWFGCPRVAKFGAGLRAAHGSLPNIDDSCFERASGAPSQGATAHYICNRLRYVTNLVGWLQSSEPLNFSDPHPSVTNLDSNSLLRQQLFDTVRKR